MTQIVGSFLIFRFCAVKAPIPKINASSGPPATADADASTLHTHDARGTRADSGDGPAKRTDHRDR